MQKPLNSALVIGATLTGLAALLHFSCIFIGAPAFRFMGAGEPLAQMAEQGHWYPGAVAFVVGAGLSVCVLYALSAAGAVRKLPLVRVVLCLFIAALLLRALAFPWLMPFFPDNGLPFWLVTSSLCLGVGLIHLVGLKQVWAAT